LGPVQTVDMKINIAKCLLELLLERGEVTIPGLGKFQMQSQPASFGAGRKSLLPPTKSFSFSESHDRNDLAFRNYLAEVVEIDSDQAGQFVSKFSSNILAGLNAKKPVELAYVGILKKEDARGKIEFLQNSMTIAKINNLLPEVALPDPKAVGERPKMEVPVPETTPSSPTGKTPSSTKPSESKPSGAKPTRAKPIKKQPVAQAAAPLPRYEEPKERGCWPWILGAILLGALLIFGIKMCSKDDSGIYKSVDPTAIVTEEGVIDGVESTTSIDPGAGTDPVEYVDESKDTKTGSVTSSTNASSMPKDCIVIVASMQNQKNISRLKSKVQSKNYELYTERHGAYTRVGMRIDCAALPGSYEDYIRTVSRDFGVNAWSLSPEFPQ